MLDALYSQGLAWVTYEPGRPCPQENGTTAGLQQLVLELACGYNCPSKKDLDGTPVMSTAVGKAKPTLYVSDNSSGHLSRGGEGTKTDIELNIWSCCTKNLYCSRTY